MTDHTDQSTYTSKDWTLRPTTDSSQIRLHTQEIRVHGRLRWMVKAIENGDENDDTDQEE